MRSAASTVLVVDDNEDNRVLIAARVRRLGHHAVLAASAREALELVRTQEFDLVLLDLLMPEMTGYEMLQYLKADPALYHLPVIIISGISDITSIVKCIELGAEDYLFKPIHTVMLTARIRASLDKKWFHDREAAYIRALEVEQDKSERLLLNILPAPIVERLKQDERTIADAYPEVTVLFADIVNFTRQTSASAPWAMVDMLNQIFTQFDLLARTHGLEKIKTMGDAYMAVGGLPIPRPDHAEAVAEMALDMQDTIAGFRFSDGTPCSIRVGIHTGPVVAGVIGRDKFSYDLWGDTVNIASRMESQGLPHRIQVTRTTYERLQDRYRFEERGLLPIKGRGNLPVYFLIGRR